MENLDGYLIALDRNYLLKMYENRDIKFVLNCKNKFNKSESHIWGLCRSILFLSGDGVL